MVSVVAQVASLSHSFYPNPQPWLTTFWCKIDRGPNVMRQRSLNFFSFFLRKSQIHAVVYIMAFKTLISKGLFFMTEIIANPKMGSGKKKNRLPDYVFGVLYIIQTHYENNIL